MNLDTEKVIKNNRTGEGHIDNAKCSWNLHKGINKNTGCQKRGNYIDFVKMHEFAPFLAQSHFVFLFYVNFKHTLHSQSDPSGSFLFYDYFCILKFKISFLLVNKKK